MSASKSLAPGAKYAAPTKGADVQKIIEDLNSIQPGQSVVYYSGINTFLLDPNVRKLVSKLRLQKLISIVQKRIEPPGKDGVGKFEYIAQGTSACPAREVH